MKRVNGVYIVGVVVVLLEWWFLVTSFPRQWQEVADIRQKSQEISLQVAKLTAALTVLSSVDQKRLAQQLVVVNAALPSQKKTSGLISGIRSVASASGVVLNQVNFSPGAISTEAAAVAVDEAVPGTAVRRVQATVVIGSDLASLMTFLSKIQAASQLIGTSHVSFSGSTARQQTASIALQVYYSPSPDEAIDWGKVRLVSAEEERVLALLSSQDVFILPEERR